MQTRQKMAHGIDTQKNTDEVAYNCKLSMKKSKLGSNTNTIWHPNTQVIMCVWYTVDSRKQPHFLYLVPLLGMKLPILADSGFLHFAGISILLPNQ